MSADPPEEASSDLPPVPPGPEAPSDPDGDALRALEAGLDQEFEIVQRVGKGSMATVYLAKERDLGRLVALKVLLPGKARDETARRRFEREARAAASLSHSNVVQVYRFGRLPDETPYLVMRYVRGRTMDERLAAEGRLSAAVAKGVLLDVAAALAAAHAQGIVHRDVRPPNVLWDEENETALLSDFGIAALLATSGEDATRLTQTGQMVGDPRYMSPEQLRDEPLTEQADIYGFGVLAYEILTGDGPYEAKTNMQLITAHLSAEPRDLRTLRPDLESTVADLLTRCLNREPKHRPSAADIVRALDPEAGASVGGQAGVGSGQGAGIEDLVRRRVPQIVVVAFVVGWGVMQVVGLLTEQGVLPGWTFRLTLPFVGCGVAASAVIAWFHGERGKQQAPLVEHVLLGVIAILWLASSTWILVGAS